MFDAEDCQFLEKIYESEVSEIYRAVRPDDQQRVVLKMLRKQHPTPREILQYRQEFRITQLLKGASGVIQCHEFASYRNGLVLIFEDVEAQSLKQLLQLCLLDVRDRLSIAIKIAEAVGQVHSKGVIHKNICPDNILTNPDSGTLKIIDFGISADLAQENPTFVNPRVLEGTLAYMAPEQTGRMNRYVDYRSDYYSLGVTLYELFGGQLPFEADDPLELVHCHIARPPIPLHELHGDVPEAVSSVVLKLLSKEPASRYQSSLGIKSDLESCLRQMTTHGATRTFPLGTKDIPERFEIPEQLYGREGEIERLVNAFEKVAAGGKEMALVSGEAGIGKTTLVREIFRTLTKQRGDFVSGKFDQFHRNFPVNPIVQALSQEVSHILTESPESVALWKSIMQGALGANAQIIIDVIPMLEHLIGPQPPVPQIGPIETQNRFHTVFNNFVRCLCHKDHPLVMFIDDIQWADLSSVKLLESLISDPSTTNLFVIVAYRDDEIDFDHPFMMSLETLRREEISINHLSLQPLAVQHVAQLVRDLFRCDTLEADELSILIHRKTSGNPFFLVEFLKKQYEDKGFQFDFHDGCWKWDLALIQHRQIPEHLVGFMAKKIVGMPLVSQHCVTIASCMGTDFEIRTLANILHVSLEQTVAAISLAVNSGLIFPVGDDYKWIYWDMPGSEKGSGAFYRFAHDKIRDAAYSLIPENERPKLHLRIGNVLRKAHGTDACEATIFDVVNQMNLGIVEGANDSERHELAKLNLTAGIQARKTGSYDHAYKYFEMGLSRLGDNGWNEDYDLTVKLIVEAAEAAYVTARFDKVETLASIGINHQRSLWDVLPLHQVRILAHIAVNDRVGALKIALPILDSLGEKFPRKPNRLHVIADLAKTKWALTGRQIEDLEFLPKMKDQQKLGVMQILEVVLSAAFSITPSLFVLMISRMLRLSIKYGSSKQAPFVYAGFGTVLCSIGDFDSGKKLGELALRLVEQPEFQRHYTKVVFVCYALIFLWSRPLKDSLKNLQDNYYRGLELGDTEYAALSAAFFCTYSFGSGQDLGALGETMGHYAHAVEKLKQKFPQNLIQVYHQEVLNITNYSNDPCSLRGEAFDEEVVVPGLLKANEPSIFLAAFSQKLRLCYLFYNYFDALEFSIKAEGHLEGARGSVLVPVVVFFGTLTRLAILGEPGQKGNRSLMKRVTADLKKLKKWSRTSPKNFLHKLRLAEAELYRILGRENEAALNYERAVRSARENEYINEEALACERAGMFYLSRDQRLIAKAYLLQARDCYQKWGAIGKVEHLSDTYSEIIGKVAPVWDATRPVSSQLHSSVGDDSQRTLDMEAVIRASQELSGQIVLSELIKSLMQLAIRVSGAERGFLILKKGDSFFVEASSTATTGEEHQAYPLAIDESQELPLAVVYYSLRSSETVLLNDALKEGPFIRDERVVRRGLRSVLCLPILRGGILSGLLYLENNQTPHVFTVERLEMLKILSAQAAISIENARLYRTIDETAERYRSLFENAQEAIFIVQDGDFRLLNPRTISLTGFSSEELFARPSISIVHPEDQQLVLERGLKRLTGDLSSTVYAFRIVKKDSTTLWVQTNSVSIMWEGRPATLSFLTDITDLKRAADLHVRTERLNAIADLAGGVAHNFNNMLQVVMAGVEVALSDLISGNTSLMSKRLERILDSSRLGIDTVKRLQSFAKIRTEDKVSHHQAFDLSDVVLQASEITLPWWKTNLEKEGIQVEMRLHLTDGCFLSGKDSELFEVLVNFIKNAAEAMPHGGYIRIATSVVDDRVVLEVEDTGVGIPQEDMCRLFQPFWTTKGAKGTGLGLSVSHEILKSHGGTISVTSTVGVGTTLTVRFPLAQRPSEKAAATRGTMDDLHLTILVIDDTQSLVTLFHDLLTAHHQTVLTATSGAQGIDLYRQNDVDLVLCDLGMPGMSGWEVGRTVRSICQDKGVGKTPFLLLTGWGGQALAPQRIEESGVDGILEKPVHGAILFETIRNVFAGKNLS